jgi:hypothetical protein
MTIPYDLQQNIQMFILAIQNKNLNDITSYKQQIINCISIVYSSNQSLYAKEAIDLIYYKYLDINDDIKTAYGDLFSQLLYFALDNQKSY